MTTPTDTASTAQRQVHLKTLKTMAERVGEFGLAIARMANTPRWTSPALPSSSAELDAASATSARCCARRDVTSSSTELTSLAPRPIRTVP